MHDTIKKVKEMIRRFAQLFDDPPPREPPANQACHHPACEQFGTYRARQSPEQHQHWVWFCLDHIREHHARWDFYAAQEEGTICQDRAQDYGWNRPTWPLGMAHGAYALHDPFGFFSMGPGADSQASFARQSASTSAHASVANGLPPELEKALRLFDMGFPFTQEALKKRFRQLVKQYHPDHQQATSTPHSEDMIRQINGAYTFLKTYVTCHD